MTREYPGALGLRNKGRTDFGRRLVVSARSLTDREQHKGVHGNENERSILKTPPLGNEPFQSQYTGTAGGGSGCPCKGILEHRGKNG